MGLAVLFSGGKDSCLACLIARENGYDISCLICVESENKESFMFHTPSVSEVREQAEVMDVPLVVVKTSGNKEMELMDLKRGIKNAIVDYGVGGVVTGAIESVYQATRVQKICNDLGVECFNPLWQRNQFEILEELIKKEFKVVVVGVFAYPLDSAWLGRKINEAFVSEMRILSEKYKINPAGEGGEFESFVLDCPLFRKALRVKSFEDFGEGNSWRREAVL